jgi:amidase
VTTYITRFDAGSSEAGGDGPRLAVKDLIDVAGVPTTAACKAVANAAKPADADAACLAGARAAGARIVGKVNLHELAFGATGVNPWFGTPVNPLDPALVPGGSSSGSAVAVATDEADVAYGSDTGGSVRIPSACCGTAGLKTTHGRISLEGVWPLASSLDTIGPMARDVDGLLLGMQLLEPGFAVDVDAATTIGRFRPVGVDPLIDAAVDAALAAAGFDVVEIDLPGYVDGGMAGGAITIFEAARAVGPVLARDPDGVGSGPATLLRLGAGVSEADVANARLGQERWKDELRATFERVQLIALPTAAIFPLPLDAPEDRGNDLARLTMPFNTSGSPVIALPVPSSGRLPASVQLVAPWDAEALLLATGRVVEAAVA